MIYFSLIEYIYEPWMTGAWFVPSQFEHEMKTNHKSRSNGFRIDRSSVVEDRCVKYIQQQQQKRFFFVFSFPKIIHILLLLFYFCSFGSFFFFCFFFYISLIVCITQNTMSIAIQITRESTTIIQKQHAKLITSFFSRSKIP